MRFILRLILSLVGFVAFFGMMGGGALWAYGQYGVPLVETQLTNAEEQIAQSFEDTYPGSDVTVNFEEVFYKIEGTSVFVAFEANAIVEVGGTEVENTTQYASIDVVSAVMGTPEFETYEASEWATIEDQFKEAPAILFDAAQAKSVGLTVGLVSAAAFVGSIVIKAVFLRKKRA